MLAVSKLHADDTPIPVLAPGNVKTKTARLWTYVRDDRPVGDSTTTPAVWFAYTPDRKGIHPQTHLAKSKAYCRQMPTPVSTPCSTTARSVERPAGRTRDANFTTCKRRAQLR